MTAKRAAAAEALLDLEDHGTTPCEVVVAAAERIEAAAEQGEVMTAAQALASLRTADLEHTVHEEQTALDMLVGAAVEGF